MNALGAPDGFIRGEFDAPGGGSSSACASEGTRQPEELYLDLLSRSLTGFLRPKSYRAVVPTGGALRRTGWAALIKLLRSKGIDLVRVQRLDAEARRDGRDWPIDSETMVGLRRLDNLRYCISDVVQTGVAGDLIETGVWRGGAVIFMRGALEAYGDAERKVWVADSFRGLPKPNPGQFPADARDQHWTVEELAVSLGEVRENFARYGLLDDRVQFLPGWFRDTLPTAPIETLSILRLDGDMYESTMDALVWLYPRLSKGGYVIVDDYGAVAGCRAAVEDFRSANGIEEPIQAIDWTGAYWKRTG